MRLQRGVDEAARSTPNSQAALRHALDSAAAHLACRMAAEQELSAAKREVAALKDALLDALRRCGELAADVTAAQAVNVAVQRGAREAHIPSSELLRRSVSSSLLDDALGLG